MQSCISPPYLFVRVVGLKAKPQKLPFTALKTPALAPYPSRWFLRVYNST
jgi:hypothetical protein